MEILIKTAITIIFLGIFVFKVKVKQKYVPVMETILEVLVIALILNIILIIWWI